MCACRLGGHVQAYYASFMPDNMREELMEVARSNNFIIKYDKFDWNLHLTKACSEASRQPQRLITNHSPASRAGQQGDPAPTTLGANQVFTPSLHEVQGHTNISDKVYNQVSLAFHRACLCLVYVFFFGQCGVVRLAWASALHI